MLRSLRCLRADVAPPDADRILATAPRRHRDVANVPTLLKILSREKRKPRQLALKSVLQSDAFLETLSNQTHRVHCAYPRIPCYFNVSRSDVLIRHDAPIVLTEKIKPGRPVQRPIRHTYITLVGPSRHALNIALWRSNLQTTGLSQHSFPVVCALQDQRSLSEGKVLKFKAALKRAGFSYSAPFQGKQLDVLDAPDDEAPYTATALLRGLQADRGVEALVAQRLDKLRSDGFLNYFGRRATMNADQGKSLLSGKWTKFFISELSSWDPLAAAEAGAMIGDFARRSTMENAKNLLQVSEVPFQGSAALSYLQRFIATKGNTRLALQAFAPAACQRYLRHVQRVVWNNFVSVRIRRHGPRVCVGDMVVDRSILCNELFVHERTTYPRFCVTAVRTAAECAKFSIFDVVLPMPYNDGPVADANFPSLDGVTLEDFLAYTERIGAKYFWDPPPTVQALLRSKPIELTYRCVLAQPIALKHKVLADPSAYEGEERRANDVSRLLVNEFTCRNTSKSDAPFDDAVPELECSEDLTPKLASKPFEALEKAPKAKRVFFCNVNGKNVEHPVCPDSSLFNDITLALDIKLPADVDFLSCLREVFAFLPLESDGHRKWMTRLHNAYRSLQKREGEGDRKQPNGEGERDGTPSSADSEPLWSCDLCGTMNDADQPQCEVCMTAR